MTMTTPYDNDNPGGVMTMTIETDTPRVWIGCLACYNNGDLVGAWFDAIGAGEVTTQQLHDVGNGPSVNAGGYVGTGFAESPHEELWCLDHEYLPGLTGECSPMEAQRIAEALDALSEYPAGALAAYAGKLGIPVYEIDGSDFQDSYCGEYESEEAYAWEWLEETTDYTKRYDAQDPLALYFSIERYARDLFLDGTSSHDNPNGGVYVFHD